MSSLANVDDLAKLSDRELARLIDALEAEEDDASKRRLRLHDRIDFVQTSPDFEPEAAAEMLASLQASEHELSTRRLELHEQIDEVRAERTRRRSV